MSFVNHKFLKKDDLEDRKYQSNISKACLEQSTLVILPTGMGKTVVALRIMLERLDIGKILLMAPTKPLAQQHFDFFNTFLKCSNCFWSWFSGIGIDVTRRHISTYDSTDIL